MEEIEKVKSLCAKYGIRPSKKLGQNFLVDANVVRMMIEHANLDANDCVVEVGPGLGALTMEMVKRVKKVVAVEKDGRLVQALKDSPLSAQRTVLQVVHGDILEISNQRLQEFVSNYDGRHNLTRRPVAYKVVASLPYSITSAVLRKFTEEEPRPERCVFLVQKEVAERVCARPGEMSVLSVAIQYYGKPEIVAVVPRSAFWPVPEVDSAILKIEIYGGRTSDPTEVRPHDVDFEKRLFQLVRIGFSSRRKQLQNNLMAGLRLPREPVVAALVKVGLLSTVRAQELAVKDWIALTREI